MKIEPKYLRTTVAVIACMVLILNPRSLFAQDDLSTTPAAPSKTHLYFGLGMGIDAPAGMIGLTAEVPFAKKLSVDLSAGIGAWGWKYTGGLNYYFRQAGLGSSIGLAYSLATGAEEFEVSLPVVGNPDGEMVTLDMNPASSLNLMYAYSWQLGKKGKFSLFTGYAVSLSKEPYEVVSNHTLDEVSLLTMKMLKPGGIMLGLMFMLGI